MTVNAPRSSGVLQPCRGLNAVASTAVNSGKVNSGSRMNRVAHFTGGVVSGAIFGKSLYVNNARYYYPPWGENWVTKLNRHAVEPVD
mgnify:FL=1